MEKLRLENKDLQSQLMEFMGKIWVTADVAAKDDELAMALMIWLQQVSSKGTSFSKGTSDRSLVIDL